MAMIAMDVLSRIMKDSSTRSIILLAFLIALALSTSLYITQQSISDTDPTTYVIVPILMLPLFTLFMLKRRVVPSVSRKDLAAGILLFGAFLAVFAYLRVYLSYLFLSYRIDMLLFPVFMAALISVLFGFKNIRHFSPLLVYALLASPVLTPSLLSLNKGFAIANTLIVYGMVKVFVPSAIYSAPITIKAGSYSVGIGETCAGIGVLIAILLFMGPLAYLYNGRKARKWMWLLSGLLLLLLFNLARMAGIAAEWMASGPGSALFVVHLFAGVVLFYISIILMVLLAGRYGLTLNLQSEGKKRMAKESARRLGALEKAGILAALLMGIAYLLATLDYASAYHISSYSLAGYYRFNATNQSMVSFIGGIAGNKGFVAMTEREANSSSETVVLSNQTFNSSGPIILYLLPLKRSFPQLYANGSLVGSLAFLSRQGISSEVFDVVSEGAEFMVYHTTVPYRINSGYTIVNVYAVVPASEVGTYDCNTYSAPYSSFFNAVELHFYGSSETKSMVNAYCMLSGVVNV